MLFFNRADGEAKPVGDFLVGKELDFAEKQDGPAAFGQLGDGLLQLLQFLAGHDLLHHSRMGRSDALGFQGTGSERRNAAALEAVEREAPGRDVEQGLGFFRGVFIHRRVDAQISIMRDVLSLGGIAQNPGQMPAKGCDRVPVETGKVPRFGRLLGHGVFV